MAENESLDVKVSPRWRAVCGGFRQGRSDAEMGRCIQRHLYRFVNKAIKSLAAKGVKLADLLHAATARRRDLPDLLRGCPRNPLARLIGDNAEEGLTHAELLNRVTADLWERLADQFGHEVVGRCPAWPEYEEFQDHLDRVRGHVQADLERIASGLADTPEKAPAAPRCPRRRPAPAGATLFDNFGGEAAPPAEDPLTERTRASLGMSLLGGGPQP